ncbi:3-hydroxyacyl-CoA dehydrogenase NAD-binding domain-containing protein [Luteolibacter algae]|uniref:enoyl-CoA hydratase n=1 Tax=Luteolibacter algae TaxID=454151 RepID=A0ABW5D504_9BACT
MSNITLTYVNTTAVLVFDRADSSANVFDSATLAELGERLDELALQPEITGLLIRSAKPGIFIAGADLKELSTARGEKLSRLITTGQTLFNRIADLPYPTVAAIHGACVGGGYELALACDWRIASDASATKIGLPETQLGILPAWGGTTRLPDLLGLQDALPVILSGKLHSAADAKRKGLVDEIVPAEHLKAHALTYIEKGKRHLTHNPIIHNQAVAALTRVQAHKELLKKTRGHYPGPEAALEVAVASIGHTREKSQQAEREAIEKLAPLPQTAQLIRLFFLQERARKHRHTMADPRPVHRAAVIGAGVMGSGIAYWLSTRKIETILQDVSDAALAGGMENIRKLYDEAGKRHVFSRNQVARGLDRIHPTSDRVPLGNCDLVIEAAVEELSIKKRIFADLASRCADDTILATNTSALPIHELASGVPHPDRLVGLHFFNPVHRMQLVEVVRTDFTSDETLSTAVAFVRGIGKLPVVVRDTPGFLVNRILMPYLVEAAALFEQGGDPGEIDKAMLDFGMPMGPLRLLDEVGLDVAMHVARTLAAAFPNRMEIPRVVEKLLDAGHIGKKGGSGFYVYDDASPAVNAEAISFQTGTEDAPHDTREILASLMTSEAERCLEEGVAETAEDIDLAMVLGTGYPPFRGGPLENRS